MWKVLFLITFLWRLNITFSFVILARQDIFIKQLKCPLLAHTHGWHQRWDHFALIFLNFLLISRVIEVFIFERFYSLFERSVDQISLKWYFPWNGIVIFSVSLWIWFILINLTISLNRFVCQENSFRCICWHITCCYKLKWKRF